MTEESVPGSRCPCGGVYAPPRARCPACGAATEAAELPGRGSLLSWTVHHRPPEGFAAGRVVGMVALDAGAHALALGPGPDAGLALDQRVRVWRGDDGLLRFAPDAPDGDG